jgi:hypothetical protein
MIIGQMGLNNTSSIAIDYRREENLAKEMLLAKGWRKKANGRKALGHLAHSIIPSLYSFLFPSLYCLLSIAFTFHHPMLLPNLACPQLARKSRFAKKKKKSQFAKFIFSKTKQT